MPRCPKCGREIESLMADQISQFEVTYIENLGEILDGEDLNWEAWESITYKFRCPECDEVIFEAIDDAKNFLKGIET